MTQTKVTVTRRDNGEKAISLTGELVGVDDTGDVIRVTVKNEYGEQYVEYDDEKFTHSLDTEPQA
jgi:hypothetical protein